METIKEVLEMLGKRKLSKNETIIFNQFVNDPDFYFRKTENGGLAATRVGYEVKKIKDWYCPTCQSYVSPERVTNDETHDVCGTSVDIID